MVVAAIASQADAAVVPAATTPNDHWVATWTMASQRIGAGYVPPAPFTNTSANAVFVNATMRQGSVTVVQVEIDNATARLRDVLSKSLDQLSEVEQKTISGLEYLIDQLGTEATDVINTATQNAQQIVNTLPLHDKTPQVTRYSPKYITPGPANTEITVEFDGNFEYALDKGFTPTLTVNGTTEPAPFVKLTQVLKFKIPEGDFAPAHSASDLVSTELTLTTPYIKGYVFKSRRAGTFQVAVDRLPASPFKGAGTLFYPVVLKVPQTRPQTYPPSPYWLLDSAAGGVNHTETYNSPPPPTAGPWS